MTDRQRPSLNLLLFSFIVAVLLAVMISWLWQVRAAATSSFFLDIRMQSSISGRAQIFYDIGQGIREADSFSVLVRGGEQQVNLRFPLPEGQYRHLRFDPINRAGTVTFSDVRIVDAMGTVVKKFTPAQVRPIQQVLTFEVTDDTVQMTTIAGATDPIVQLLFDAPLSLGVGPFGSFRRLFFPLLMMLCCWGGLLGAEWGYQRLRVPIETQYQTVAAWANGHPQKALLGVALSAVILSCYPIVFFGKSFVSPNNATILLYDQFPTVPGYNDQTVENPVGSDVGAVMWAHLPYSVIESRALLDDYELPLWNRYNSAGVTLLGQGQSIFGDPLHFIVLLARGASWAWDCKYLLAKLLFTFGFGVLMYSMTQHLPAALLSAFSSAFIGFFSYRFNHPAFFSLCYAPWILVCWWEIVRAPTPQRCRIWLGGLFLINWMELHSGTVKEAYMLLVTLNACGLMLLLFSQEPWIQRWRKTVQVSGVGVLFVMASAPTWLTFLHALRQSYTAYDHPHVWQIQPGIMIGLFDDIFYRQLNHMETVFNPSANFLIFAGFLWSIARFRSVIRAHPYWIIALNALFAFSLAFGVVPASTIIRIPFLANVAHVDGTFSNIVIIEVIMLAGFGFRTWWQRGTTDEWKEDFLIVLFLCGGLLALYMGTTHVAQKSSFSFLPVGGEVPKSRFFYLYGLSIVGAMLVVPWLIRSLSATRGGKVSLFVLLCISLGLLFWRHGMHVWTGADYYVMNPHTRENLQALSPALEFVKKQSTQPFRAVGFDANLFPGYTPVVGVEGVSGPDALVNPYYRELQRLLSIEIVWDWRTIIRKETLPQMKSVYDFLNVKYYFASSGDQSQELPGLRRMASLDLDVYTSDTTWPRAFFTDVLVPYKQPEELVARVKVGDGRPFAMIQHDDVDRLPQLSSLVKNPDLRQITPATNYRLTNNTTTFTVITPSAGIIVLTEAYLERDFIVTVNAQPVPYFRINHAFKGILVDKPGTYTVTFSYWPRYLTLSLWGFAVGLLILVVWLGLTAVARTADDRAMGGV